jgi:hypothetical protein
MKENLSMKDLKSKINDIFCVNFSGKYLNPSLFGPFDGVVFVKKDS